MAYKCELISERVGLDEGIGASTRLSSHAMPLRTAPGYPGTIFSGLRKALE